mgnify:FL=1
MSDTLVTAAEYSVCVRAGGCTEPDLSSPRAKRYSTYGTPARANYPMNYVDYEQAAAYCAFVGGLVPDEEEWLWAYGSARNFRFPWGDVIPHGIEVCNIDRGTTEPPLCPARAYLEDRTAQGIYDVAGSLDELVRTGNSALPRKRVFKPGGPGNLLARASAEGASEQTLALLDVRDENGVAKGLGFSHVVSGASGMGFRCVWRQGASR